MIIIADQLSLAKSIATPYPPQKLNKMGKQSNETRNAKRESCGLSCKKMLILASIAIATLACGCSSANKVDKDSDTNADTTEATADRNNDVTASQKGVNAKQAASSDGEDKPASVAPLTQYALIEVLDEDMGVGFRANAAEVLKTLGFTIKEFKRPADVDEMEPFVYMTAHRQEPSGSTNIAFKSGEDQLLTIDFANREGVEKFVESMEKSGYVYSDGIYAHPQNSMGKIYVKVQGLKVKIIFPFEMPPYEW